MNSTSQPDVESVPRWLALGLGLFGGYLLLDIAAYTSAGTAGLQAVHAVLFGWLSFLSQRLETFQPDWPTAIVGVNALVLLLITVHLVGRKVARTWTEAGYWTWRSSLATTMSVLLLFAGGVSLVGATHQAIWLTSDARTRTNAPASPKWPKRTGPLDFITQARMAALQTQSRNNLKQMGLAIHNYHELYNSFPAGAYTDDRGQSLHGWIYPLGGFVGFYTEMDWRTEPWDGPENQQYSKGALLDFINPQLGWHGQFDEHGYAYMHYAANVHGFPNNRGLKISEITDGTSNTLAIGEVAENFQPWASPWNRRDPADGINAVPWGFGGPPSQQGALFAFFDGQVRLISRDVDRRLLTSLGLPTDGFPQDEWESKLR